MLPARRESPVAEEISPPPSAKARPGAAVAGLNSSFPPIAERLTWRDPALRPRQAEIGAAAMPVRITQGAARQSIPGSPIQWAVATFALRHARPHDGEPGVPIGRREKRRRIGAAVFQDAMRRLFLRAAAAIAIGLAATASASSQTGQCALAPDERNPPEQILRCGDGLIVRTAHDTHYRPVDLQGKKRPNSLQLDDGALMVEFHPGPGHRNFQILTPHAITGVRGTKWVVEVTSERSSTLVISGRVAVSRLHGGQTVVLKPGEGADVDSGGGPITVKRWAEKRVRALLARVGE